MKANSLYVVIKVVDTLNCIQNGIYSNLREALEAAIKEIDRQSYQDYFEAGVSVLIFELPSLNNRNNHTYDKSEYISINGYRLDKKYVVWKNYKTGYCDEDRHYPHTTLWAWHDSETKSYNIYRDEGGLWKRTHSFDDYKMEGNMILENLELNEEGPKTFIESYPSTHIGYYYRHINRMALRRTVYTRKIRFPVPVCCGTSLEKVQTLLQYTNKWNEVKTQICTITESKGPYSPLLSIPSVTYASIIANPPRNNRILHEPGIHCYKITPKYMDFEGSVWWDMIGLPTAYTPTNKAILNLVSQPLQNLQTQQIKVGGLNFHISPSLINLRCKSLSEINCKSGPFQYIKEIKHNNKKRKIIVKCM